MQNDLIPGNFDLIPIHQGGLPPSVSWIPPMLGQKDCISFGCCKLLIQFYRPRGGKVLKASAEDDRMKELSETLNSILFLCPIENFFNIYGKSTRPLIFQLSASCKGINNLQHGNNFPRKSHFGSPQFPFPYTPATR